MQRWSRLRPLARFSQCRGVTVWPQWPYDENSAAKPVGDPNFRWPPNPPLEPQPGEALTQDQVKELRKKIYRKIFHSMCYFDWSLWERYFWELKDRAIPYDETAYTLLLHGYILSHRHQSENAYLVLDEMKRAETHPALVRLNERMMNSAFELKELGVQPMASSWQNVVRLCFHCSVRFQKKRQKRLRAELEALEPDDALALDAENIRQWLSGHDRLLLPEGPGRFRFLTGHDNKLLPLPQKLLPGSSRSSPRRGRRSVARRRDPDPDDARQA